MKDEPAVVSFPIADIKVERETRQRTTLDKDVQQLAAGIESSGLINPIVIHADGRLVAGERRLEAHKLLKRTHIRATVLEKLSPEKAYLIELQENLQRRALSWQDEAKAVQQYHAMKNTQAHGGWTILGTENDLGISKSEVSRRLIVAAQLDDPEVVGCQTLQGALNLIKGRAERATAAAQSRGLDIAAVLPTIIPATATKAERTAAISALLDDPDKATAEAKPDDFALIEAGKIAEASLRKAAEKEDAAVGQPIVTADFTDWIKDYTGPAFDVLHIDFPYGKNYSGSNTRRTGRAHVAPAYADDPDIFWALLETLLEHQDKIAYPIAHCIFWFDMEYYAPVRESFEAAGWKLVQPHPLIWTKPYQGVAADTRRRPRHCYETALLLARGDRKLVRLDQDYYDCRVDEKLHLNQKPQQMLKHFLRMIVDEHTAVFDPTCGSGSALAAARSCGSRRILGLELDESNAEVARFVLTRHEESGNVITLNDL